MAKGKGSGKFVGTAVGMSMGAFGLLAVALGATALIGVLSVISTFPTDNSVETYYDEFSIDNMMMKFIYSNTTDGFVGGAVVENTQLSELCASALVNTGEKYVDACVLSNMIAYGPNNVSSITRRKRGTGSSALYVFGKARLFYYTTCGKKSDAGKYYTSSSLSKCVQKRLFACNQLFNSTTSNNTEWQTVPSNLYISVVSNLTNTTALSISKVYGIRASTAIIVAGLLNLTSIQYSLSLGCKYVGMISRTSVESLVTAQSSATASSSG